ncbi:MAG TPA: low-specificity L-threonine aldolase [Deferrisomatales bacterium]|nr:low-specificity L-threonine aldolase [Deferrisomatales bacterium]
MQPIDLRSDTVTQPTPAMRQAMFEAPVGDDVYGEDPTVNRLEQVAAQRMGKESALFLASGTQANQVAILSHTGRGEEVIVEEESHIFYYEAAGIAALSACQARTVPGHRGAMDPNRVEAAIRAENIHYPRTALICVENTHNRAGGTVLPPAHVEALAALAHRHGLPVHMDGARVFNAAIAQGSTAAAVAAPVDSVMFCLSKGLAAPVGALLAGSREWIARARRYRKLLGGGMRQAGILAAAGLVALDTMVDRLAEDHANARELARGLAEMPGLGLDLETVQTNMVLFEVVDPTWDAPALVAALAKVGVLCGAFGPRQIRLVTHNDVAAADVAEALDRIEGVLRR